MWRLFLVEVVKWRSMSPLLIKAISNLLVNISPSRLDTLMHWTSMCPQCTWSSGIIIVHISFNILAIVKLVTTNNQYWYTHQLRIMWNVAYEYIWTLHILPKFNLIFIIAVNYLCGKFAVRSQHNWTFQRLTACVQISI